MILLTESGHVDSFVQFVTVLLLFLIVLFITYGVTRWISGIQKTQMVGRNMEIVDTMRISSSKYLQIVRAGDKYLVMAVCKDTVTMLAEISKESLVLEDNTRMNGCQPGFREILEKIKNQNLTEKTTDEEK
ncbi:MAG: flagellar biosynthetic protein FliO [Lachnospiraceae bacterium]|nr:flagellar biosynthetic protein FliO [Lachnospiraceae bacterium]